MLGRCKPDPHPTPPTPRGGGCGDVCGGRHESRLEVQIGRKEVTGFFFLSLIFFFLIPNNDEKIISFSNIWRKKKDSCGLNYLCGENGGRKRSGRALCKRRLEDRLKGNGKRWRCSRFILTENMRTLFSARTHTHTQKVGLRVSVCSELAAWLVSVSPLWCYF